MANRRRPDDIFKKLNKQKPLVRRKDVSSVSSSGAKRSSYDLIVERKEKQRKEMRQTLESGVERETRISRQRRKPVKRKSAVKQAKQISNMYQGSGEKIKRAPAKSELDIFAKKSQPKPKIKMPHDIDKTQPTRNIQSVDIQNEVPPRAAQQRAQDLYQPEIRKAKSSDKPAAKAISAKAGRKLSFRHELKYYINYRDYIILRNALKAMMSADEYSKSDNSYHIRSLYFDDMYDSALQEKVAGSDDRYKYRIRIYNFSDDIIKFEKKIKKGQFITKKSILLSREEYEKIIAGDYEFLMGRDEDLAREIYLQMKTKQLRPRVLVDYTREAYEAPFENVRITFDRDLKGSLALKDLFDQNAPVMPMYDKGIMVLEVKFNQFLPHHIKCVLNGINASDRGAISKYVICRKFD